MQMQGESGDILGAKKLNYQFLLLVRDQKYPQALELGKQILKNNPENPSVLKFCQFIEANNPQLKKMVDQEKQQEEYESVDSDDDDEEGDESSSDGQKSDKSDEKESEEEQEDEEPEQKEAERKKVVLTTCTLNQIPHICSRNSHLEENGK